MVSSNEELDAITKFHYLKSALEGSAAECISSIIMSEANYVVAWKLLCDRFDNKRLLTQNHVTALLNIDMGNKECSAGIKRVIDQLNKNLRSLESLGEPTEHWDTLLIHIISRKLDPKTYREWEEHRNRIDINTKITLSLFITFLRNRADFLEFIELSRNNPQPCGKSSNSKVKSMVSCVQNNQVQESASKVCPKCNKTHHLSTCPEFLCLSNEQRLSLLPSLKLCYNCLNTGHFANRCKKTSCKVCHRKHHTLVHVVNHKSSDTSSISDNKNMSLSQKNNNAQQSTLVERSPSNVSLCLSLGQGQTRQVLLSTALLKLYDKCNREHIVRALLDSGSTSCIITETMYHKLDLPFISINKAMTGINNSNSVIQKMCRVNLTSLDSTYTTKTNCFVLPTITDKVPCQRVDISNLAIPTDIVLADPNFHTPSDVDLIIGANIFWDLLGSQRINLGKGNPILIETRLGWIVSGPSKVQSAQTLRCNFINVIESHSTDLRTDDVQSQLTQFWKLEEVSCKPTCYSKMEQECENHFVQNTTRLKDGRFCVKIPLTQDPSVLGESLGRAKHCFISLERRLSRQIKLKNMYTEFMNEYKDLGHMSESSFTCNKILYFIPHHGVLRDSSTTKLRAVFNASSLTTSGLSLNNIEMVGPTIQDDLLSILIRFRQHKYVLAADIEKMYRQVLVHPDDRHLQHIVWRSDPSQELKAYELNTVTYGTASAPFLAIRCLKQVGLECNNSKISDVIMHDFYVDDLLTGASTLDGAKFIQQEVTAALASACLPLRKWKSNEPQLLTHESARDTVDLNIGSTESTKTLGISWITSSDELCFPIHVEPAQKCTKRSILSTIGQVFDPLGLLAPCIVPMKIMLQKLWLLKLSWDEPLPSELCQKWEDLIKVLPFLCNVRIPRAAVVSPADHIDVHVFSDASQDAYGACLYIASFDAEERILSVRLMMAKSRVAPLKTLTIPRLELCGALTAARIYERFKDSLRTAIHNATFWTDSSIVLGWLHMMPNKLQPFVRNRVTDILDVTGEFTWRHVPTHENPADLLSRGVTRTPSGIMDNDLWWLGPSFLRKPVSEWPSKFIKVDSNLPELRSEKTLHVMEQSNPATIDFSRFSNYNRLLRSTAYVLRFLSNIKGKIKLSGPLSVEELNNSLKLLIKLAQSESFLEYKLITNNKKIPIKNPLNTLNLFLDDNKLLRVGGCLENSNLSYQQKHPIVIQSSHILTKLLFEHEHKRLMHAGPQLLLASIRETYWPIGGRNLARSCFRKCVRCCRMKGKISAPLMGNLPRDRITPSFPFENVGTDYAGPINALSRQGRGSKLVKVYIVLFVCFATKAIHIELVGDLTSNNFLCALYRFVSRRGKPKNIFSDNGTAYKGACNDLAKFLQSSCGSLAGSAANDGIKFNFTPAYAPHFGGLWEAGVKSVKHHLYRVLGTSHLTYEELSTVLVQIEGILNSRPLTPLSPDPDDLLPLTPAHFLIGRPLTSTPTSHTVDYSKPCLSRFHRLEQLRLSFGNRWSKEYVTLLQERVKWKVNHEALKLNALVLLKDENLPPLKWRLGRIIQLYPGTDAISRVADVRTSTGVVRRAFNRICPLLEDVESH